jgi:hypothetical protein
LPARAARAAVREASVDANDGRVRAAATHVLPGAHVSIGERGAVGESIDVTVRYKVKTDVPIVGALFPDRTLTASASMRVEE